jgi:hypothetical protein
LEPLQFFHTIIAKIIAIFAYCGLGGHTVYLGVSGH